MLTRLHGSRFGVTEFNPTPAKSAIGGGRFDAMPEDAYAFLYAASDDSTAVSESLLRDLPSDERGFRFLHASRLHETRIGWLRTTRELELVNLRSGADLAAIGQDTWLTNAPADDYAMTRRWAMAIREWAPWAQGLTWRSRREPDGFAYVLFGDRCPDGSLQEVADGLPLAPADRGLTSRRGRRYVRGLLARYRALIGPPDGPGAA